jgi:hypothetical protein
MMNDDDTPELRALREHPRSEWPLWNGWYLEGTTLDYRARYPVTLEALTSPGDVLDLICQVAGKNWADDACLAGLVRALNDILAPQAYLCGGGITRIITESKVREIIKEFYGRSISEQRRRIAARLEEQRREEANRDA